MTLASKHSNSVETSVQPLAFDEKLALAAQVDSVL
jgi:hypothetical protein